MAIGDAADAAGMETLAGTEDLRESYIEHNRTRDYLANHQTGGSHPASAITSGTLDEDRIPALDASKITTGTSDRPVVTEGNVVGEVFRANEAVRCTPAYSNDISGGGGYRALWVAASNGDFGWVPSTQRIKKNIRNWKPDPAAVLALKPVEFDYRNGGGHDYGLIAEAVAEVGLHELVDYNEDGTVEGVFYERRLVVALLATVQSLAARIEKLEGGDR